MESARSFAENNTGYGGAKFNALVEALESRDAAIRRECADTRNKWIVQYYHDVVSPCFNAMRNYVSKETMWNILDSLMEKSDELRAAIEGDKEEGE